MQVKLFFLVLFSWSFAVHGNEPMLSSLIQFDVEKYQLENGLTVLLHQDNSAPVVSYHTWFRVGSKDEQPGQTGIAHLFEHMMFMGTEKYPDDAFDKILQSNGAENNAFTSRDYTGYYEELPSSKLELIMDLESDRMINLKVDESNLNSEREVVKEERRQRVENSNYGKLNEVLFATAYKVHPYKWPVIGWMKDLNRMTDKGCKDFYQTHYAPNNAVLVIAGDIDISKTKELVKKYYGSLKSSSKNIRKPLPVEPEQKGFRFLEIKKDVQGSTFMLAYHTPKSGSQESYALDLLGNILGEGQSSKLYKSLVYSSQLATSAYAYNSSSMDSGLFRVTVSMHPDADYEKTKKRTLGIIYRLRNRLVTEKELKKAKNQIMKSYVDSLKTVNGRASALAINEVYFSDYRRLFNDLRKYSEVTPEQVQEVARKYLTVDRANLVLLSPKTKGRSSGITDEI